MLRVAPFFRAIVRAAECRLFGELDLAGPTLDVGCGDGTFAYALEPATSWVGVDPSQKPVREAQRFGAYSLLTIAEGGHLPFSDNSFGSVVSNSTLEHIPDVDPVLREMYRVLKPGGTFAVSFPSQLFYDYHLVTTVASALRIAPLESAYRRWVKWIARVHHADPPSLWRERLEKVGLEVLSWRYYYSHFNTAVMDVTHYVSVGSLLTHYFLKRWVLWPGKVDIIPVARWVSPFTDLGRESEGSLLFFHCQKRS